MDQQDLNLSDDEPTSQHVHLDQEQLESLLELMSSIVVHVFNSQEILTHEHSQED